MRNVSYGSWISPISPSALVGASAGLDHSIGQIVGDTVYWTQSKPDEDGRNVLLRGRLDLTQNAALAATEPPTAEITEMVPGRVNQSQDAAAAGDPPLLDITEVAAGRCVRSGVNEYGGGAWAATADSDAHTLVVYSDWPSNELRICSDGNPDRLLAPGGPLRYGCLSLDLDRRLALAVREDHRNGGEPITTVVALDLDSDNADGGKVIASGADFYAYPVLSADGLIAYVQWNHPNMPWDDTSIMVAPLDRPDDTVLISTGGHESAGYPSWTPYGSLVYLSDLSGYWNFRLWDREKSIALHEQPHDFCDAAWSLDPVPYTIIDQQPGADDVLRIGCSWLVDGIAKLGVLTCQLSQSDHPATPLADNAMPGLIGHSSLADSPTSMLTELGSPAVAATISGHGQRSVALLGFADRPAELSVIDWNGGMVTPVLSNSSPDNKLDLSGYVSVAQPYWFDGELGPVHAWYYPPTNAAYQAPTDELPPVQIWSHGGPTGFSSPAFKLQTQFWTTRGIGILDVNYSGSTGFGRHYRERLAGRWGITDVSDCAQAAQTAADHRLADPKRLSIRGSSAGGYTTLAALVFTDVFTAGISVYGIGDLETLTTDTHKFESRYLDGLIADYPAGRDIYLARSPRYHLDRLSAPMLILQGLDDHVVPPEQAFAMADAVRAKGLQATLITFAGEGHGFRKTETIIETAKTVLAFLGEVYGFTPAEVSGVAAGCAQH